MPQIHAQHLSGEPRRTFLLSLICFLSLEIICKDAPPEFLFTSAIMELRNQVFLDPLLKMSMHFLYSVLCTEAAFNDAKTVGGINNQRKSQSWSLPLSSYIWGGPHDHSEIGKKGPSHSGCNEEGPHLTPSLKCLLRMGATQQVRSLVKFGSHFAFTSHW